MISEIFKAYDVRAIYPDKLNENAAWKVGCASGRMLRRLGASAGVEKPDTVLVSRDMRPHSPQLAAALIEGLRAAGANVIDLGMCDTSIIYFAVNYFKCAGGIQTTASHNPIEYNGFKISGPQARPIGADTGLKEIAADAETLGDRGSIAATGSTEQIDIWPQYRQHILSFLTPPTRPVKVVIDASNGMAGKLIPMVFNGVQNLQIVPINFEITGSFVHPPNPLEAENMVPTQQGVKAEKADLGACFDGDADRCMLTDEKGQIIGCDHLTGLLCNHFIKTSGQHVVYDLRSSKVVEESISAHGATPHRSRVGHVFMKGLLRETGAVFGGELSGHFYFRDNYFADSGAIAFAAVVSMIGRSKTPLSELVEPFRRFPQSGEINFKVEDKKGVMA